MKMMIIAAIRFTIAILCCCCCCCFNIQGAGSSTSESDDVDQGRRRELLNNGLALTPPMGWNSWNRFGCNISEKMIKETADAIVAKGMHKLGYVYINIDDCWAEQQRNKQGRLVARHSTFPSGMKALGDYIHNKGLKFGIYSDAGNLTCSVLQPGSLGHEDIDAQTFASWGVDYLKYDNCFNQNIEPKFRYPVMRDALLKTGRPIFYSLCEWGRDHPATWAKAVGNSWRTTGDIRPVWHSIMTRADLNNKWARYAGPGGWNDPDMLEVGNGNLKFGEARSHFSLWALMKAPLLIGCDMRNMTKETFTILSNKEVIAINQDKLGVQGQKVSSIGDSEVWVGPLTGHRVALFMWNKGKVLTNITAHWRDLGLSHDNAMSVRDVWMHGVVGSTQRQSVTAEVKPHDCRMFILSPI